MIVTGGLYSVGEMIVAPAVEGLDIHGDFGAPMPQVTTTIGGKFFILRKGDSLRYLKSPTQVR